MSMENSDTPLLEVKNRCVDYITDDGDFNAVKSVSFSIGQGEIFGLAGESSCCKSTIAFAINRLQSRRLSCQGERYCLKGKTYWACRITAWIHCVEVRLRWYSRVQWTLEYPVLTIEEQFADVLRHHKGQIVEWGSTQSILTNPQHPYTSCWSLQFPIPIYHLANSSKMSQTIQ